MWEKAVVETLLAAWRPGAFGGVPEHYRFALPRVSLLYPALLHPHTPAQVMHWLSATRTDLSQRLRRVNPRRCTIDGCFGPALEARERSGNINLCDTTIGSCPHFLPRDTILSNFVCPFVPFAFFAFFDGSSTSVKSP